MRLPRLSALLITAALTGLPWAAALAAPATAVHSTSVPTSASATHGAPAPISDAERYSAREAADQSVAEFQGGSTVLIGGGTVTLVLVIIILVILL